MLCRHFNDIREMDFEWILDVTFILSWSHPSTLCQVDVHSKVKIKILYLYRNVRQNAEIAIYQNLCTFYLHLFIFRTFDLKSRVLSGWGIGSSSGHDSWAWRPARPTNGLWWWDFATAVGLYSLIVDLRQKVWET